MRRRSGRPGLLGTIARTAVIAGTANAVTTSMQRGAADRAARPAPSPPSGGAEVPDDSLARLTALSDLRRQGLLSEAEFTAAKAQLLGL